MQLDFISAVKIGPIDKDDSFIMTTWILKSVQVTKYLVFINDL
jgi:hypothetical protein